MESKKYKSADLSVKKGLYFNIGLAVTMALVLSAFEYTSSDSDGVANNQGAAPIDDLVEIPPTEQPQPKPPKIQQPEIIEVPDEEEIEEELEMDFNLDVTEDEEIEAMVVDEGPEEEEVEEIFTIVEEGATPAGGMQAFYSYVNKKIKYPSQARRMGIEGKVFVEFIIDKDGSITNVRAVKGIGAGCDEEAVRVIRSHPKWAPGKQRGRPVKQRIILPITFKLG